MLSAYNELIKQYEQKSKNELIPEKEMTQKKEKETITTADSLSGNSPVENIQRLKNEVGKMLTGLSDKLDEETIKYEKIKQAISIKEKEIKELYEIEKAAHSLAALINAHNQKQKEFEEQAKLTKEKFDAEMNEIRLKWQKEKKEHEEQLKQYNDTIKKQRDREKEEYSYSFEREKQQALDTFNDEKDKIAREIEVQKAENENKFAEIKADLDEREKVISEREKNMNTLQQIVDSAPEELEKAVNKAIKETSEKIISEKDMKIELIRKEFEGQKNVYESKIEAHDKTVAEQKTQLDKMSAQLVEAYEKIQGIAMKTVEGTSHSKIVNELERMVERNPHAENSSKYKEG